MRPLNISCSTAHCTTTSDPDYCQLNQIFKTRYMDPLHNCNEQPPTTCQPWTDVTRLSEVWGTKKGKGKKHKIINVKILPNIEDGRPMPIRHEKLWTENGRRDGRGGKNSISHAGDPIWRGTPEQNKMPEWMFIHPAPFECSLQKAYLGWSVILHLPAPGKLLRWVSEQVQEGNQVSVMLVSAEWTINLRSYNSQSLAGGYVNNGVCFKNIFSIRIFILIFSVEDRARIC